ncbi:MAG: phosphate acyltransferase PlsX [Erysipelotrichaceae bacterium]|nr:phosphate acyltransferase PlsX [Erysipelotrichaceae bacterium]
MKLVVDTMGGDLGSGVIVSAILDFLQENKGIEIIAVGKKEELTALEGHCRIVDAPEVVPMEAGALQVLRMKNSSMMVALKLLKDEQLDGVVSCGSTGGFLSASTITLRLISGVKRAALVAPFPSYVKGQKVVILDIGANNENSAEELAQFAIMGRLYSQSVFQVKNPRLYLLSNGTEEGKGSPEVKEAQDLLHDFPGYQGNIEARVALDGRADVIVTDGFTGNIFLKGTEGIAKFMGHLMKQAFKKNLWSRLGYLHVRKGINEISETMDYKSTGGAMLLGLNGVVVKAHGSSDAYAFKCALNVAKKLAENHVVEKIKEGMNNARN